MKQLTSLCLCISMIFFGFDLQSIDSETQNLHRHLWANYNHAGGNLEEAQKWYDTIFATKNASIYTYKSYLYFLKDAENFQKIALLIPKLEDQKALTEDPSIELIIIQALEKTGRLQEAIERLIHANNKNKGHQELAYYTANLYLQRKEPKSALIVIDNFLSNCPHRPNNFIFYFLKSQILVQLGQTDQAIKQLKQCVEIHPNFEKAWLFYAMLEEKRGILNNAIKNYLTYLELTGGNSEVEQHLIQLILNQNMVKQQSKSIAIDSSVIKQTNLLFEQKRYHEALEHLQEHLNKKLNQTKGENNPKVYFTPSEYKKSLKLVKHKFNKLLYINTINSMPQVCLHYEF